MKKALKIKSESNNLKINYDSIYELDSKKLIKLLTSMAAALYRKQHVEKLVLLLNHQKEKLPDYRKKTLLNEEDAIGGGGIQRRT